MNQKTHGRKPVTDELKTVTADKIVAALIDRLIKTEIRLASLEKESRSQFEMICENIPRVDQKNGTVQFNCSSAIADELTQFEAVVHFTGCREKQE